MARKLLFLIPTGERKPEEVHRDIEKALKEKMPELYKKKYGFTQDKSKQKRTE